MFCAIIHTIIIINIELKDQRSWIRHMERAFKDRYRMLGLNIAFFRKKRGYSQEKLAELVDISRTHMSRIETAECAVSLDIVFRLADVLSVDAAKLFEER